MKICEHCGKSYPKRPREAHWRYRERRFCGQTCARKHVAARKRRVIERFCAHTQQLDTGCLVWTGYLNSKGYASLQIDGKNIYAHRWAYEYFVGPIPDGLVIDHLCRVRNCVNPEHLEPVTPRENVLRGLTPSVIAQMNRERGRRRTACRNGHEFTPDNTGRDDDGHRFCRTCQRAADRRYKRRLRQQSTATPPGVVVTGPLDGQEPLIGET